MRQRNTLRTLLVAGAAALAGLSGCTSVGPEGQRLAIDSAANARAAANAANLIANPTDSEWNATRDFLGTNAERWEEFANIVAGEPVFGPPTP